LGRISEKSLRLNKDKVQDQRIGFSLAVAGVYLQLLATDYITRTEVILASAYNYMAIGLLSHEF
jgi:hypothetical protein